MEHDRVEGTAFAKAQSNRNVRRRERKICFADAVSNAGVDEGAHLRRRAPGRHRDRIG